METPIQEDEKPEAGWVWEEDSDNNLDSQKSRNSPLKPKNTSEQTERILPKKEML